MKCTRKILRKLLAAATAVGLMLSAGAFSTLAAGPRTVHVSTTQELIAAIASDTTIVLDAAYYSTGEDLLEIRNVNNLTIQGAKGTKIATTTPLGPVIWIEDSSNVALDSLTLGHDIPDGMGCGAGVIYADNTTLTLKNCDIYGCGLTGLTLNEGTVTAENTTIRDCSYSIMEIGNATGTFRSCVFSGNGYIDTDDGYAVTFGRSFLGSGKFDGPLKFIGCTFKNNKNASFIYLDDSCDYDVVNCIFTGNAWGQPPKNRIEVVGSFSDVLTTAWYADTVKWAVDRNITSGTSKTAFSPEQTCNQAQILTMLYAAAGKPEPTAACPYANVTASDWYYKAVAWAAEKGILTGSTFNPTAPCTRADTVTYLYRNAGSPAVDANGSFSDVPAGASYASAVAWAVEKGVTAGMGDGTFGSTATCTRAQIVTFLKAALG